jgi:hypothetical protein
MLQMITFSYRIHQLFAVCCEPYGMDLAYGMLTMPSSNALRYIGGRCIQHFAFETLGFDIQTRTSFSLQHAPPDNIKFDSLRAGFGNILVSSALIDCIFGQLPYGETSAVRPGSIFQALA